MMRSIDAALEHLVLEQLVGERVELGAVGDDHPLRGAAGLLDQVLALLVADPQRASRKAARRRPGERPTPAVPIA